MRMPWAARVSTSATGVGLRKRAAGGFAAVYARYRVGGFYRVAHVALHRRFAGGVEGEQGGDELLLQRDDVDDRQAVVRRFGAGEQGIFPAA